MGQKDMEQWDMAFPLMYFDPLVFTVLFHFVSRHYYLQHNLRRPLSKTFNTNSFSR